MSELTITEEELKRYGPHEDDMRRVALFSVANDFEAHGYPMPPHCDSLLAQNWCYRITRRIGASYVAHIPYATDSTGDVAVNWSPIYIPFEEFYAKVREFVGWHLERLSFTPSKVAIIIGHGGNRQLPERADDLTKRLGIPVMCLEAGASEPLIYPEFEALDAVYEIIAQGGEHAYILEYSLMAHLGHLDNAKLKVLNDVAEKDPLDALKRWPAIAGLGGYIEFGGPEYDPLRKIGGLCAALEDFKKRRKILVDPELGRRANALIVNYLCERIQER
jgi:creatinine amidohydrolase/Fe(II)-dependent formamide hydrolase-like protein